MSKRPSFCASEMRLPLRCSFFSSSSFVRRAFISWSGGEKARATPLLAGLSIVSFFFFLVERVRTGENFWLSLRSWETYERIHGTGLVRKKSIGTHFWNTTAMEKRPRQQKTYLPIGGGRHDRHGWHGWFAPRRAAISWVVFFGRTTSIDRFVISFDLLLHAFFGHGARVSASLNALSINTS